MPVALLAVAVVAEGYSIYEQGRAAKQTAAVDVATADFNAKYDESLAAQLDVDTLQNVRVQRDEGRAYISRQAASYASAGVLATSGSPLHAQITNAGRIEQHIQQDYVNSQQKQQSYAVQAKSGRAAGEAKAYSDRVTGKLAMINGAGKIASTVYGAYDSGVFSGFGGNKRFSDTPGFQGG